MAVIATASVEVEPVTRRDRWDPTYVARIRGNATGDASGGYLTLEGALPDADIAFWPFLLTCYSYGGTAASTLEVNFRFVEQNRVWHMPPDNSRASNNTQLASHLKPPFVLLRPPLSVGIYGPNSSGMTYVLDCRLLGFALNALRDVPLSRLYEIYN